LIVDIKVLIVVQKEQLNQFILNTAKLHNLSLEKNIIRKKLTCNRLRKSKNYCKRLRKIKIEQKHIQFSAINKMVFIQGEETVSN